MSLFLGPIHHWLYNKIGNQEKLTEAIAVQAEKNGWIVDSSVYTKELSSLETVIDESNIHGWLQERISDAESRYASLIAAIHAEFDTVKQYAYDFGRQNAINPKSDAAEIYKCFEDFFVNGMPCDHVNAVTEQSEDSLSWKMSQDIHVQYWPGDAADYYTLRKAVMDGMLGGTAYTMTMSDPYHYFIQKK